MELIAAIILGVIVGSLIGWMASRGKQQALVAKNEMLQAQLETQKQEAQQMLRDAKEEWSSQLEMAKQEAEKRNQTLLVEKEKTYLLYSNRRFKGIPTGIPFSFFFVYIVHIHNIY